MQFRIVIFCTAFFCQSLFASTFFLNTSNPHKLREFQTYLPEYTVVADTKDLEEPQADAETVVAYKASQLADGVFVDDTSLDVVGADFGVNIKFLLENLKDHIGKEAKFVCLLGSKDQNIVRIYRGEVSGTIVAARGDGFGFDNHFLPTGATKTLGEDKPLKFNARSLAIEAFRRKEFKEVPLVPTWSGKMQGKE